MPNAGSHTLPKHLRLSICLVKTFVTKSEHSEAAGAGLFAIPKPSCPGTGGMTNPAAGF